MKIAYALAICILTLAAGCATLPTWIPYAITGATGLVAGGVAGYKLREAIEPEAPPVPPPVVVSPTIAPEAAPLIDALSKVVRKIDDEGTPPKTPETAFAVEAVAAVKQVVGDPAPDAKPVERTAEAARAEAARIAVAHEQRIRELESLKATLDGLRAARARMTWGILGMTAVVALAGVVVVWLKFGQAAGLLAAIIWAGVFSALGVGALYQQDSTVVVVAGALIIVVAIVVVIAARLLHRDVLHWLGFAQKRVITIQEVRRLMSPEDRAKLDALLKQVQGHDRQDEAAVAQMKADLDLAHVT